MFLERDLVRLIIQLHPYTQPPAPPPPTMTFGSPPAGGGPIAALDTALDAQIGFDFPAFNFETQDNPGYQLAWTWHFKGQERIIRRALRFEYRYPVYNGGGALATDYVLIGY